eukprot:scaffold43338_cov26-Prasinocladus_malaysianus.AAC.2
MALIDEGNDQPKFLRCMQDGATGDLLVSQSVKLQVEISAISVLIKSASSYRNSTGFNLTGTIVDPDATTSTPSFTWACKSATGICFTGDSVPEIVGGSYRVSPGALSVGNYTFTLTATKGVRTAITSKTVNIIDGNDNPPVGSVQRVCYGTACNYPDLPVSGDKTLRLRAVVEDSFNGTASFRWSSPSIDESIVDESALTDGTANGETEFVVTAPGWVDAGQAAGTQSLRYTFGYCTTFQCSDPDSFISIADQASSTYTFSSLPKGVSDASELTIKACAVDVDVPSGKSLSKTCQTVDVVVNPANIEITFDQLSNFESSLSSASGASSSEAQKVAGQAVTAVGDILRTSSVGQSEIQQVAETLKIAGTAQVSQETRIEAVSILRQAAASIGSAAEGDLDVIKSIGTNLFSGLGAMLSGVTSNDDESTNG